MWDIPFNWKIVAGAFSYHLFGFFWFSIFSLEKWRGNILLSFISNFACGLIINMALWHLFNLFAVNGIMTAFKIGMICATGFILSTHIPKFFFKGVSFKFLIIELTYHLLATCGSALFLGAIR